MDKKVKIQELDSATRGLLPVNGFFQGCRFRGPSSDTNYTLPIGYKEDADNILNMVVRPDDVWVTGYPRSGTTLTQELVWQVMNDCDFVTASKIPLMERYMFLEGKMSVKLFQSRLKEVSEPIYTQEAIAAAPSPRFIKTHVPFSLLPSNLLDNTKVVYIARDPRDVAVSFYQISKMLMQYAGDMKSSWNLLMKDLAPYSPILTHVKEAWELRDHPNLMFMFYEDMLQDLPLSVKRIADFLGKKITNEQIIKLCEHLNINNFRKNESVNPKWMAKSGNPNDEGFIRKGVSGAWREQFDEEMAAQAQRWMRQRLAGTDLRFPDHSS